MEFYREGFLHKAGKGIIQAHLHWRSRYFVLDGLRLKYYKTKEQLQENLLGCIEVSEMESVGTLKNEKHAFQITTKPPKARTYYMSGRSDDEVQGWIRCLEMAKAKYQQKFEEKNKHAGDVPVLSQYSTLNITAPEKPSRSMTRDDASDPPSSPINPASPSSPVSSQYDTPSNENVQEKINTEQNDSLYQDPTYDTINDNAVPTSNIPAKNNSEVNQTGDTYETVIPAVTKKSNSLPKKKKLSSKKNSEVSETADTYETVSPVTKKSGSLPKDQKLVEENSDETANMYDTVLPIVAKNSPKKRLKRVSDPTPLATGPPPLPARLPSMSSDTVGNQEREKSGGLLDGEGNPIGVYDEIGAASNTDSEKNEIEDEIQSAPLHVYAKPEKKANSMKKKPSKRRLFPGLMDVGEVDIDIEQDAAGSKESLERGMTKPIGDRFAIEDLRDMLVVYDRELNNYEGGKMSHDFDVNQCESAFEVLKIFLHKYE